MNLVRVGQIGRRRRGLADREGACIIQRFNRNDPSSRPSKEEGVKFDAKVQGGIWRILSQTHHQGEGSKAVPEEREQPYCPYQRVAGIPVPGNSRENQLNFFPLNLEKS